MPLYVSSTVVLIVRRPKLYSTVSGIITLIGGQSSLNLCTGRPPIGVMLPETVEYNFGLLMMSTRARNI